MGSRYVVLGAGAVGGVVGGGLLAAGREVVLVARGEHLERIRAEGLVVVTPTGRRRHRVRAEDGVGAVGLRSDDVVLLAVKSQDSAGALESIRATGAEPVVVCAQNGVANEPAAARFVDRVVGAMVWIPATFLRPGEVEVHTGPVWGVVEIGRYPEGVDATARGIASDLGAAGFAAPVRDDVMVRKHGKLLGNLSNTVRALVPPGPEASRLERALRREAEGVLRAAGIVFTPLRELTSSCSEALAGNPPVEGPPRTGGSTWQSLARATGSLETDYLNGEVARLGLAAGMPAPLNRHLQRVARRALASRCAPRSLTVADLLPPGWAAADLGPPKADQERT